MSRLICLAIDVYQWTVSPLLGGRCRYVPSCSEYMKDAVHSRGLKGVWAGLKRIGRCAPWGGSGLDIYEKRHS